MSGARFCVSFDAWRFDDDDLLKTLSRWFFLIEASKKLESDHSTLTWMERREQTERWNSPTRDISKVAEF